MIEIAVACLVLVVVQAGYYHRRSESQVDRHGDQIARLMAEHAKERSDLLTRIQHPEIVRWPTSDDSAPIEPPDDPFAEAGTISFGSENGE